MLFEAVPLARETADDGGYATLSELLILSKRQLSLEDLRSAVFRFAAFAEGPQADVRNVRKAVHTLTQLVEPLRGFYGERPEGKFQKRNARVRQSDYKWSILKDPAGYNLYPCGIF